LHSGKPSFGLYFATAALANIPFWIYTGVIGLLGLEGDLYLLLMLLMVLLGGVIAGMFLMARVKSAPLPTGLKAGILALIVNVLFGVGTFSSEYAHVLLLVLVGFLVGVPVGCFVQTRQVLQGRQDSKSC